MFNLSHFAIVQPQDLLNQRSTDTALSSRTFSEMKFILAASLGVALLILIWAVFFRKKNRQDSKVLSTKPIDPSQRKRKRKQSLPRNPTLAETGGLPPVRDDQP